MKIKARNLEQMYRELGAEKASLEALIIIIEHIGVMNEQMNELTQTVSKLMDMLGATAAGYGDLRRQVERLKHKHQDDDMPDNI
jgi:nucleoside-triphosphatase THEP1